MKHLLIVSIFVFLLACDSNNKEMRANLDTGVSEMIEIPVTKSPPRLTEPVTEEATKKVVKTGGIDFQSENIEEDYKSIRALLPKYNAYIENENQGKSDQRIHYSLTIRVPSDKYDTLYSSLSAFGSRIDNKYSNIEDVTERYYDLKTRIKNKKALELRYIELLDKATDVKDILEIENNLNTVRTEIEGLEGQFNYLSKQVSYSTINLSFYEILPYVFDSSQRKGFGARILSALDNGWQGFLSFVVGITTLWPFIILIIAAVFIIRKIKSSWKGKKLVK